MCTAQIEELEGLKKQREEIANIEERSRKEREDLLREREAQGERDAKHRGLIEQLRKERREQIEKDAELRRTIEGMFLFTAQRNVQQSVLVSQPPIPPAHQTPTYIESFAPPLSLSVNYPACNRAGLESEMESGRLQLERQSMLLGELRSQLAEVQRRCDSFPISSDLICFCADR